MEISYPEVCGKLNDCTVYRWTGEASSSKAGRPSKITSGGAEKMTVMVHDLLRQGSCVNVAIVRPLFIKLRKQEGLNVKLSTEWVRQFLHSINLSYKAAAVKSGPKFFSLEEQGTHTRHFILKIAFFLLNE